MVVKRTEMIAVTGSNTVVFDLAFIFFFLYLISSFGVHFGLD